MVMVWDPDLACKSIPRKAKTLRPPGAGLKSTVRPRNVTEADLAVPSVSRKTTIGSPGWRVL
jgi:hypothetical protein